jgi:elongation factor G
MAGYRATKEALREINLVILEPIMKLNISVAKELRGVVLADISKRRGVIYGEGGDKMSLGDIFIPLSEVLDYNDELYRLTGGKATCEMEFKGYEERG